MDKFLHGRTALVTGSTSGIGLGIACALASAGANVAINGLGSDEQIAQAIATVKAAGAGQVRHFGADLRDAQQIAEMMDAINAWSPLDVLVNNAGTGSVDSFLDTPVEHWDRVVGVNLKGTFLCAREAARLMVSKGTAGTIINFSSTGALTGEGPSHYVASKAGVMGLTRSLARELAPQKIRVNTIVPGPTDTPMMAGIPDEWMQAMIAAIPLGRLCQPDEVARVVAFMASDDAGFITGQNITVNGGSAFI